MLPGLILERPLFRRERADGLFVPATYLTHKISEEVSTALVRPHRSMTSVMDLVTRRARCRLLSGVALLCSGITMQHYAAQSG